MKSNPSNKGSSQWILLKDINSLIIFLCSFFMGMGIYVVAPAIPEIMSFFKVNEARVGLIISLEAEGFFMTKKAADRFSYEGKPEMVKWYEEINAVGDSLELCRIAQLGLNMPIGLLSKIIQAVTGFNLNEDNLMEIGERIIQLERVFNLSNGMTPADDRLPERFLFEELPTGASKGEKYDLKQVLAKYYKLRHWDLKNGWPSDKTLLRLGISKTFTEG